MAIGMIGGSEGDRELCSTTLERRGASLQTLSDLLVPTLRLFCREAEEAPKLGALHVTRRRACRCVSQSISHCNQTSNSEIELFCLVAEHASVDANAVSGECPVDIFQREPGRLAESDQRKPIEN